MSHDERYDDRDHDRDDDNNRDDALKIRTRGSRVVKVKEWEDGRWRREDIDRNERYILRGDLLVHERGNRVRYYADSNGDGIWHRTNQSDSSALSGATNPDPVISGGYAADDHRYSEDAYRFDLVNGQVTNLQEFDDGRWQREAIDSDETWSFDGSQLIKTEREGFGYEISTFSDPNGDGIFTKISEVYAANL